MKRFLTNLILIISILSILVIPSFAATTSDTDEIVILKQPTDTFGSSYSDVSQLGVFTIFVLGDNLSYQWQYSEDQVNWSNCGGNSNRLDVTFRKDGPDRYIRCIVSNGSDSIVSRVVLFELSPTNLFNFIVSCLRYITSYISLIVNSLVIPGAPLFNLLPVLCIGIAVAALLIVTKIIKASSWGM